LPLLAAVIILQITALPVLFIAMLWTARYCEVDLVPAPGTCLVRTAGAVRARIDGWMASLKGELTHSNKEHKGILSQVSRQ